MLIGLLMKMHFGDQRKWQSYSNSYFGCIKIDTILCMTRWGDDMSFKALRFSVNETLGENSSQRLAGQMKVLISLVNFVFIVTYSMLSDSCI